MGSGPYQFYSNQFYSKCLCNQLIERDLNHIKLHHKICSYSFIACRDCFGIFLNRKELKQHQILKHHQIELKNKHKNARNIYFKCDECNKLFMAKWRLNKHKKEHDKPYQCDYLKCNKSFSSNKHLRIHYRSHNKIKSETCKWCKKLFIDSSTLRNHIKAVHSDIISFKKNIICKICNKSFIKKSILKIHYQTHLKRQDRNLIYCKLCDNNSASFVSQSGLNKHLRNIH